MNKAKKKLISLKTENIFGTKDLKSSLKEKSVRSGAISIVSQMIKFTAQLFSSIALARLLTPEDYGLLAMVTAITGFIALFKDFGLSIATIQRAEINHYQITNLFWINLAVSTAITAILVVVAPIIAWFYDEPRLSTITIALGSTFILSGLTVQHLSLLKRQMSFKKIAIIDIVALIFGITIGISLALYGVEYWALVGLHISTALASAVMVWFYSKWRPSLPVRNVSVTSLIKFGSQITGFNIVNYFSRNFDNILLGKFCGAGILGLYSKAYNLMMLPTIQIRGPLFAVAMPALSLIQDDPNRFNKYYIKLVTLIAFLSMPVMVFLFIYADQVIYLLLGNNWIGTSDIFKILCINAFIQPTLGTVGIVLVSLGQSKRYLIIGTLNSIFIVISFLIGLPWQAIGVALAYTIMTYALIFPVLWYSFKKAPVSIIDFFSAISRPAIASMTMGFIIFVIRSYLIGYSVTILVVLAAAGSFVSYFLILFLVPGGSRFLKELYSYRYFLQKNTV